MQLRKIIVIAALSVPALVYADPKMKCVDGSGRVIYTDLPSCVEAFRALPPPQKSAALKEVERLAQLTRESQKNDNPLRAPDSPLRAKERQEEASKRSKARINAKYELQRKDPAAYERLKTMCEGKRKELDKLNKQADDHPGDQWWWNQAVAKGREYEADCGYM